MRALHKSAADLSVKIRFKFYIDNRVFLENTPGIELIHLRPNPILRIVSEFMLCRKADKEDTILCFSNLPLLFKSKAHSFVYMQNRFLIGDYPCANFPFLFNLKIKFQKIWLNLFERNVDEFVVQNESMEKLLGLITKKNIIILPFFDFKDKLHSYIKNKHTTPEGKFIYVAAFFPHKNHFNLIKSFIYLKKEGIFPYLYLTISNSDFIKLMNFFTEKEKVGLMIFNLGVLPHEKILNTYNTFDALIYPSLFESFGLPLLEAKQAGIRILASEADYVRDLLDPDFSFDPNSAFSIARSIKRFLGINELDKKIFSSREFLEHLLGR